MSRVLHVMRSPVGGLFRHVLDLSREQIRRGHAVGLLCDRETGGDKAQALLTAIAKDYALGVHRISMARRPGLSDILSVHRAIDLASHQEADVVHGHGAKGGAYARLIAARSQRGGGPVAAFYTPHGGALHYDPHSRQGRLFFAFERFAQRWTNAILFESQYGLHAYADKVGRPTCPALVIHNGIRTDEFSPVTLMADAVDLLFIGEMRKLKGVSVLLDALALLASDGRPVTALLVGDGPDVDEFKEQAMALRLRDTVRFAPPMPARDAFARARAIVVPSLNESLPYIVLEAAAAGLPMVATAVGGIPEIFAGEARRLIPPGDPRRLAGAIAQLVADPNQAAADAAALRTAIKSGFSIPAMADGVLAAYAKFGGPRTADLRQPAGRPRARQPAPGE